MTTGMIYLASPYSHPSITVRTARYKATLDAVVHLLLKYKLPVYSPIVHNHPVAVALTLKGMIDLDWEFWANHDIHHLKHCSELRILKLDGWGHSTGISAETVIAQSLKLPITYMDPV